MAGSPNRGAFSGINAPHLRAPTNKELNFDPDGYGWLGTSLLDPLGAAFALAADRATRDVTRKIYPTAQGSDEADAFRHGVGSRLLRGAIGETRAKTWGDAHEVDGIDPRWIEQVLGLIHQNAEGQRAMDLYNNRVGRGLPSGRAPDVQDAVKRGLFRLRPFGE